MFKYFGPLAHVSGADEECLRNLRIKDVYVVSLYFYTRVRYPHGTRSETHGRDGFHALHEAKHFANFERRQGTGFLIHQLPALLLVSNSCRVAIAQIGTTAPLAKYSPFAIRRNQISGKRGTLSLKRSPIEATSVELFNHPADRTARHA
jgi:hypothetical protein